MKALYERGANQVVQPEFEAALEMTRQSLLHLQVPATEILRYTDTIRRDLYTSFHGNQDEYHRIALLKSAGSLLDLSWFILERESRLSGRTIGELAIRTQTGASVVGVVRNGTLYPNPGPDFRFVPGDMAAVIGKSEQFNAFQKLVGISSRK